jgi:hypothetical protein
VKASYRTCGAQKVEARSWRGVAFVKVKVKAATSSTIESVGTSARRQ